MDATNARVARMLRELAELLELQQADRFRIRAWRDAARAVEDLAEPVDALRAADKAALTRVRGLGKATAAAVEEYLDTGTVRRLDELRAALPASAAAARSGLPGFAPLRLAKLMDALGVRSLTDLESAARRGAVRALRGYGPATEEKLLRALETRGREQVLVPRADALAEADPYLRWLRRGPAATVELAGACRRLVDAIDGLVIAAAADDPASALAHAAGWPGLSGVDERGPRHVRGLLPGGLPVLVRVGPPSSWGALLHGATGSAEHARAVRAALRRAGIELSDDEARRDGAPVPLPDEDALWRLLDAAPIPPELREGRGELEAAREGALPRLLVRDDLRGDLQMHSTASDGQASIEEMAAAARARGYEYIAITDHTPAVRVVRGLDRAAFEAQWRAIDRLNARLDGFRVLKGAEVDILADGTLDLDDDTLRGFDVVLASIHSRFDLPPDEQTRRVLRAIAHPAVRIFAHPTGRRIGKRPGAGFDWDRVLPALAEHGVALEINASPDRLDAPAEVAYRAARAGIGIVVSTDAHAPHELDLVAWGVDQARRAALEPRHVLNTRPLPELLRALRRTPSA